MDSDFSRRDYRLPPDCKDLADTLVVVVTKDTTVAQLATRLHQRPERLIADLYQLGVFAAEGSTLKFEVISRVAQKYGYTAQRA